MIIYNNQNLGFRIQPHQILMINLFCDQSWCRFIFKLIKQIINQQEYKKFIKIMEVLQMGAHSARNNKISNISDIQLSEIPAQTLQIVKRLLREDLNQRQLKKPLINRASILFINPSSFKISIWNFIIIFTAYFIQFGLSLTLAFGPAFWSTQIEGTVYMIWYIVLLVLLFLDILVNLNKGYYAFGFGTIIDDRSLIIKKYLRGYFIMDLICLALLIIPLFISGYIVNYIQLISIVLLVFKKFKCQAQITRNLQYYQMLRIVFTLGMLGCDVMLLGHFGACVFLGIDLLLWRLQYFGNNQQYYWLSNNSQYSVDLMSGPQIAQYVYAQSFSTGTLSTLAPGPFGKNFIQISIQLFIMTYFMILASYVAQVLIVTFYNKQMVRIFHDKNIGQFDHFLALKGVLEQTKRRVHGFFQLIWQLQVKNQTQLQKVSINKLPLTIRQNLLYQMSFSNQLKFVKYFSLNVQREIQNAISFKIKSYIVDPNTTIFQIGPVVDSKGQAFIYNMKTGLAKYYLPFGKFMHIISLSNLRKITGEYEYFTGLSHAYCGKSIDLSFVQKISFSDLTSIIKTLNLQEQYFIMRFQIMLYNKMDIIERRCLICNQKHRQNCCTLISMHDDTTQKLKKQQKMPRWQQTRRIYHRNKSRLHPRIPSKADSQLHILMMKKLQIVSNNNVSNLNLNNISDRVNTFQKFYTGYNLQ